MIRQTPGEEHSHAVPMPESAYIRWSTSLYHQEGSARLAFAVLCWRCAARTDDVLSLQVRDVEQANDGIVIDFIRSKQLPLLCCAQSCKCSKQITRKMPSNSILLGST